jgi:hypothetical protein
MANNLKQGQVGLLQSEFPGKKDYSDGFHEAVIQPVLQVQDKGGRGQRG